VSIGGFFGWFVGYCCGIYWFIRGVIGWVIVWISVCWRVLIGNVDGGIFFVILMGVGDLIFIDFYLLIF
jgi:hypothetical protein